MASVPRKTTPDMAKDTGMAAVLCWLAYLYLARDVQAVLLPALLLVLVMAAPRLFHLPARLWFGLAHLLGAVSNRVLLSLVYVVIVVPIGLLLRLLGKDPLGLKAWRDGRPSAFVTAEHRLTAADLERPF